ncbi:MAG: hypothetical protein AAB783_00110 [Patescibacteria group bacterium]
MAKFKTEIVPAINVSDFSVLKERIHIAQESAHIIHIDVADGSFTPHAVWNSPQDLQGFQSNVKLEIHLMVANPDEQISQWLIREVSRVIVHAEVSRDPQNIIQQCHAAHIEVGISICPDTSWEKLTPFVGSADMLQLLAVMPGPSGQKFDARTIDKLKNLRQIAPDMLLEVDGGIKVGVARQCQLAGANLLVAGSALFGDGVDFKEAFIKLNKDVE